jgi:integrase/recombinase XerD
MTGSVAELPYHPHIQHEQVETTQMYLHADLALKERALARITPLDSKPGRYRPPDALLGFLDGL